MTTSYLKSLSDPTNRLQKADRESVPQSILNLNPLRRLSAQIREIIPGSRAPTTQRKSALFQQAPRRATASSYDSLCFL